MWTCCHICQYSLKLARYGSTATLRVRLWVWANPHQLVQEAHGVTHVRRAILTHPRTERSLSSPQTEWCQRCRQRLGNCNVLGENSQPGFKTRQLSEGTGPPRLERQTQPLCMFDEGHHWPRTWSACQQGSPKSQLSQSLVPCSPPRPESTKCCTLT